MQQRIQAMRAEGFSVREIARELGLSRMKVHRVLQASPPVPVDPVVPESVTAAGLSAEELALVGLTPAEVAAGLNELERYRLRRWLTQPESPEAAAARKVLALPAADDGPPVAGEPVPAHVRDARILQLRREGWTLQEIATEVQMTKGGVLRVIDRLTDPEASSQER